MRRRSTSLSLVIGLICGSDGVATLPYEKYQQAAVLSDIAVWVSCARLHREHFEISGPDAMVAGKVSPSDWPRLTKNLNLRTYETL